MPRRPNFPELEQPLHREAAHLSELQIREYTGPYKVNMYALKSLYRDLEPRPLHVTAGGSQGVLRS